MKRLWFSILGVFFFFSLTTTLYSKEHRLNASHLKLPLYFIKNEGQGNKDVLFYEQGRGHTTAFARDGVSLVLSKLEKIKEKEEKKHVSRELVSLRPVTTSLFTIESLDKKEGKVNYLIGNDPSKWRTNIPTYGAILYRSVYPGIDMKFYGTNAQLEYDIIVSPHADPSKIRLAYEGIEKLSLSYSGELEILLKKGKLLQKKPLIYQTINGIRKEVEGRFILADAMTYGFKVGAYDTSEPLVIDPVLEYSTYLGGSGADYGRAIALDVSGCLYIAGSTASIDFPTHNPLQASNAGGSGDVIITKLNASASTLIYSTYFGGTGNDYVHGIAVDASGSAYVTGGTDSIDLPTLNPYQASKKTGEDAFVAKINPAGSALVYSTYLGGSANDYAQGIAVDSSGNAHVAGTTGSSNFPTVNAYQASSAGNFDAFVSKFNASGTLLMYSTYLGGWQTDSASSIAVDDFGNAYVAGHTFSNDFPTLNAYQTSCSDSDAFVAKLDASGNALYSTYLGGTYGDYGTGIAVDTAGNAYVTGYTKSPNFPTLNAYQSSFKGYYDTFITKLAPTGSALVYSTFFGGVGDDWSQGIAVDSFGNAYVVGYTSSTNFPTKDAYQAMNRTNTDSFVTKLDASGSSLCYSTYLGGTGYDFGHAIAIDSSGNAYVTGETASTNFPMKHPYQGSLAGGTYDVFITKLDPTSPYVDLNLKSISNPPSIISTEENFSVTVAVQNRSNVPLGGFVTKYYLSNTPKMMKAKLLTGTLVFPFIEAETTSVRTMNVSVPTGTPAGVYYLFACVDDQKAVAESDEKNNCKVASRTVSLRAVPRFSAPPSPKPPLKN